MDEITGPVIAITLVLSSVFIPTAFLDRDQRRVLSPVRPHHRGLDHHLRDERDDHGPPRRQLIKPHNAEHDMKEREALPRLGIALIGNSRHIDS